MQDFSNHLAFVCLRFLIQRQHLKIQSAKSPSYIFFFFDNLLHLDVRHNSEKKKKDVLIL